MQAGRADTDPRAAIGNRELTEELSKVEHLEVEDIATYDTCYESQELIDERMEFEQGRIDYAVFTSASTVKGFARAVEGLDYSKVKAVCIGKQTKSRSRCSGDGNLHGQTGYHGQRSSVCGSLCAGTEKIKLNRKVTDNGYVNQTQKDQRQ